MKGILPIITNVISIELSHELL